MSHRAVTATEVREHGWLRGLHAKAHARHTAGQILAQSLETGVFGIALDGHFGVVSALYRVQNAKEFTGSKA